MKELKEKLLNLGVFEDNEYLDFYCNLIQGNREHNLKVETKLQRHHIIPRCYYRQYNLKVDNSSTNLVLLTHFNHCLAHYYLCFCLTGELKYKNEYAFIKMVNISSRFEFNFNLFLTQASKYDQIYNEFILKQSIKAKKRFSNGGTNKNKHYFTNGDIIVCKDVCPEGFISYSRRKGIRVSNATRDKMSLSAIRRSKSKNYIDKLKTSLKNYYLSHSGVTANRKWVTNGIDEKLVDLNEYTLEDGWKFGRSDKSKLNNIKNAEKGRKIYNENKKAK